MTHRPPGPTHHRWNLRQIYAAAHDYLGFWNHLKSHYGDVVHLRMGVLEQVNFFHPDAIRQVLVEQADAFIRWPHGMRILAQAHGQSLLIAEGDEWQRLRRTLIPGFMHRRLQGYGPAMVASATEATQILRQQAQAHPQGEVDFEAAMDAVTIQVITRTMFGAPPTLPSAAIAQALRRLGQQAMTEMFIPFALPAWLPLPVLRRKAADLALLDGLIHEAIRQQQSMLDADPTAPLAPDAPLLAQLVRQQQAAAEPDDAVGLCPMARPDRPSPPGPAPLPPLSPQALRDQCMTLFLAGFETTAAGLTWTAALLATHPEWADAARQEIHQVLGTRAPTVDDLPGLKCVDRILKESLRLYSPAPGVFTRQAVRPVTIAGWPLPPGTCVPLLSHLVQRDPRWFPEPERFDPDRFTPERARTLPRGAYFPFGLGPRVCIGQAFAQQEMALTLTVLLQHLRWYLPPGQTLPPADLRVTLRPRGGLRLRVETCKMSNL